MRNYKIIDAFPFNGEFDMLRMRLDYLYNEVDFFFICESTVLQSGESKILTYESHSSSFEQYKDKIIYRVFEPNEVDIEFRKNVISYDSEDRFHLENKHRDFMREPLSEISDANTMIMLSDVDEFPRVELFDEIWNTVKDMDLDAVSCNMRTFYYSPLCELDINSYCTVIMNDFTLRNALRLSDVRNYTSTCKHFENGGWHLSFFHTPERIQKKIKSYSHSEFNTEDITNIDNIKFRMKNSLDVLCRKEIHIIKHDKIANDFPIEFYKHEIFTMNMNIDFDDKFRVLDTFVFGGELDMLEMRLDYLHDSVDYFIFCESTLSHSGQPKDLVYKANIDRFKKYENKIHYVVYDPDITDMKFIPNKEEDFNTDFWKLERGQRNKLLNKIIQLSDERTLILHSDLDEIPDRTKFYELRQMTKDLYMKVISLQQTTHYYAPNNILDITWYGTVAFNHKTLINIAQFWTVRENRYQCKHIDNAGWHFSFFFKPEDIQNKIKKYVHQEFNLPEITDIGTIRRKIFSGLDILNRDNVKIKRMDSINPNFPKEFYRYDFFFQNTFNREYLKPAQIFRKNISQQIRLEIENLQLAVSEHSPKVIVEIGTARGGTLCRWFEIPSATTIISIDKPLGIHGGTGFEERTYVISDAIEQANLSKKEFYAINGDSKDPYILNRLRELLHGRKIDFLFIDGDHTYEGVKNDFILYQEFLNNNAIVAFHDIIDSEFHTVHDCFVYHFWQELKQKYEFKEFIYTDLLDPVSNSHFYEATSNYGGFAGIGMIYYNSPSNDKKKITTDEANISLIVPIYNNVDNAINNTKITLSYSKHIDEIILYSNGTTEENNKKLQEFAKEDSRIRLEIVPNPIGFVKAVNNSIKLAKNNLILSLNSDAYLYFDWESRLLPFCLDEKYGLVGPILVRDFILGCCTIFKKDIINRIGMLDEGYDLGYEDDVEYSDRVKANGFKLGFCDAKRDVDWDSTTTFPIVHVQGQSFNTIVDKEKVSKMIEHNLSKSKSFAKCKDVIVLKEMQYEDILKILNENDNFIIVNKSGDNFEKIRYDETIIKLAKVLECTNDMDIDKIIDANTKGKHCIIHERSEISHRLSENINYQKETQESITLIIPVYNNASLAIKNLNTVVSSSKLIDEVIIYSNGSNNGENEILLQYAEGKSHLKLFIEERQIGFVKAVNESIKIAKNELLLCLNSDAELFDNWESLLEPLWQDKKNGLVGPILCDNFLLGCCLLFKKSVLNKVGLLNEGYGLGYCDDAEISKRIKNNGYQLGYFTSILSENWTGNINFPINHIQNMSFGIIDSKIRLELLNCNLKKSANFEYAEDVSVFVNFNLEELKPLLNEQEVCIVINESGTDFEKIRFDDDVVKLAHVFECTENMNMYVLIDSICKGKSIKIIKKEPSKSKKNLTWLAKFDDYSSMGILSQNIIKELSIDVSCQPIIGKTETKHKFILDKINKPINNELGIMFSYPDTWSELNRFKTKVIYTGLDTTGGIPNFVNNIQNADFILTPSQKSKDKMVNLGVTKPIFVFPHGIDADIFQFNERIKSDIFKFLYVGECSDRKGIFQLLEAFISLFGNNTKVELHIKSNSDMFFYDGNEIAKIKESHNNIYWHISNEGHDEVIKLYNSCHAYIYPSRADTFGMTLLEAMACGLPILSTDAPGATEIIKGRYYCIDSKLVTVKNHPWMLGEWVEPDVESLKKYMYDVYINYESIISSGTLRQNSDFIRQNFCWKNLVNNFELNILPKLEKNKRIITLVTSFNRSHHIENVIKSLKNIRESGVINDVYIVENSTDFNKSEIIDTIKRNIDENFRLYISEFNMGQRGALLQMLEDMDIDSYDYIQFSDQDNEFVEPLSTYCEILDENEDIFFVTGYMSKEHVELGTRHTKHGKLFEKRSMRAGHMFLSVAKFKTLLPIHLDSQYGQPHNSSWNAGLDWELTYWNKNAPGRTAEGNFILCVPGGVIHKGIDSTIYNWNVEENEYSIEELKELREYHESV